MNIIFFVFIITVIFSLSIKKEKTNDISFQTSTCLKGVFCIVVVFSHLINGVNVGYSLISINVISGALAVGVFFFISGYGLMMQYIKKENYLNGFISKRMTKILVPFITMCMVYTIYYICIRGGWEFSILSILRGEYVKSSWYVTEIIVLYLSFYFFGKICGRCYKKILILVITEIILFILFLHMVHGGSYWYISTPCFAVGMIWSLCEKALCEKYSNIFQSKKTFIIIGILSILLNVVSYSLNNGIIGRLPFQLGFIVITISIISFALFVATLSVHVQFKEKCIYCYIGKWSFEIYMLHGLFIELLHSIILPSNMIIITCLTLILTIVCSMFISKINQFVNNKIISYVNKK